MNTHPGGIRLTENAIRYCAFPQRALILDLGCGSGATLDYLSRTHGFRTFGVDKAVANRNHCEAHRTDRDKTDIREHSDPSRWDSGVRLSYVIRAQAEHLPVAAASVDGVLMECSLSLMDDREAVLTECRRVLTPGGRLIVSDVVARGEPARLQGCLGRIDRREDLTALLERNGFAIELCEDHSDDLPGFWGQLLLEHGSAAFYGSVGADAAMLKRIKCGYCQIIARKRNS